MIVRTWIWFTIILAVYSGVGFTTIPVYGDAHLRTIPYQPKMTWDPTLSNPSSYVAFPILLAFFLLGTIFLLEPIDHYLVARIAITIAAFVFVFAFITILTDLKPEYTKSRDISTFAYFLLRLVLVSAIGCTISSVVGYRVARASSSHPLSNQWIERIFRYRVYDVLAAVLVLGMSIYELVISGYSFENSAWIIGIIILGLGWGLLCHAIFPLLSDERARVREIKRALQKGEEALRERTGADELRKMERYMAQDARSQKEPIEVSHDGFRIITNGMETGKKYSFKFIDSEYEVIKNDKGELILSEVG